MNITLIEKEITNADYEELEKVEHIIKKEKSKRKLNQLIEETNIARMESAKGNTLVASNKKELQNIFNKMIEDED